MLLLIVSEKAQNVVMLHYFVRCLALLLVAPNKTKSNNNKTPMWLGQSANGPFGINFAYKRDKHKPRYTQKRVKTTYSGGHGGFLGRRRRHIDIMIRPPE